MTTRKFWGCPRCCEEFTEKVTPYHEIELCDFFSERGDFVSPATWKEACSGNGKPTIQYERDLETNRLTKVYSKK